MAFGLTVLTMVFAVGHISGGHFNPAVSLGLVVGKRFPASDLLPYVVAQVVGAIAAAGVLYVIASGSASFNLHAGFATNGYGANSPGGYSLLAGFVAEVVLTAFFLIVIMGATDNRAPKGFAAIAIGLCLTLLHLVCIPVTNTFVNPARSTGPAIFAGGAARQQLWMFWVAPLIGGALGGGIYCMVFGE
ncbi:MAG: aquaporin Z [Candidatus Sulfotelmatobacter sp.]